MTKQTKQEEYRPIKRIQEVSNKFEYSEDCTSNASSQLIKVK
jgi:hypothetical protein